MHWSAFMRTTIETKFIINTLLNEYIHIILNLSQSVRVWHYLNPSSAIKDSSICEFLGLISLWYLSIHQIWLHSYHIRVGCCCQCCSGALQWTKLTGEILYHKYTTNLVIFSKKSEKVKMYFSVCLRVSNSCNIHNWLLKLIEKPFWTNICLLSYNHNLLSCYGHACILVLFIKCTLYMYIIIMWFLKDKKQVFILLNFTEVILDYNPLCKI